MRLYTPLCPSIRWSVGRSVTFYSCPNGLVTPNMAPAHPHATVVAVYPALFWKKTDYDNTVYPYHDLTRYRFLLAAWVNKLPPRTFETTFQTTAKWRNASSKLTLWLTAVAGLVSSLFQNLMQSTGIFPAIHEPNFISVHLQSLFILLFVFFF